MNAIPFASILISGLLAGNELAVALFIHPVLYTAPDEAHVRIVKPLAGRLGRYMPFWYAASLVFMILQLCVTPRGAAAAWWSCCAAAILFAVIIVLTIMFPVPINNRIAALDLDHLPPDWMRLRRRWDVYHDVRVLFLIVVLGLLVFSALSA